MRRVTMFALSVGALFLFLSPGDLSAQEIRGVEVVEVSGIIDASVERTVLSVIDLAEQNKQSMVILQIDSPGAVGRGRAHRLRNVMLSAEVPIVTWVGPAGARAANGAVVVLHAGIATAAPGAIIGPLETVDFQTKVDPEHIPYWFGLAPRDVPDRPDRITGTTRHPVLRVAPSLEELIDDIPRPRFDDPFDATFDTSDARIRFHNLDLFGRLLHAAAQPSITYLLLLLALVGIVFELFHPSNGPAGVSGLAALALALYGIVTLGGSWLGFGLIVAGVALFAVDLRYASLGPLTAAGFAGLVAGSLLLFRGPWLRVSPWVLAFGITSMVLFLVGAMTRVLRDLRSVARGELEVRDAHPHPNGQGG